MSAVLTRPDPGPMQRFREVIAEDATIGVIVQRLTDGETLRDIAKAWQVPYGKLAEWMVEDRERSEKYNAALKIWADSLAQECVRIADEQAEVVKRDGSSFDPDVPRDKLRIDTRLKLAGKWNRERYGDQTDLKVSGHVSLITVLGSLPRGREAIDVTPIAVTEALPSPAAVGAPPGEDLLI